MKVNLKVEFSSVKCWIWDDTLVWSCDTAPDITKQQEEIK